MALNQFVYNPHFKMESITSPKDIVRRRDFMGRLDLKDAYLTVSVTSKHWRFLRFRWRRQGYEFRTIPFGLASAPRVFTKLLRPVAATLQRKGVRLLVYFDYILVMAQEKTTLEKNLTELTDTLSSKSIFEPSRQIEFLGYIGDSERMLLLLPQ